MTVGLGETVGFAVGVALLAAVGAGVAPPLLTENGTVSLVVAEEVTILTLIECEPFGTFVVSQGLAVPVLVVPTKSIGAECSMCIGVPLKLELSSQKSASVTPDVGVRKT